MKLPFRRLHCGDEIQIGLEKGQPVTEAGNLWGSSRIAWCAISAAPL
jgi:hypothetical protein